MPKQMPAFEPARPADFSASGRRWACVSVMAALLAVVGAFAAYSWKPWLGGAVAGSGPTAKTFRVSSLPVVRQLFVRATVGAGKAVPVLIPFDGIVQAVNVQLGDHVDAGDILMIMDGGDVESRSREAQASFLKAAMVLDALDHWETGPDVTRARRTVEAAEATLSTLERQVTETKLLLDRGIVSRNEHDALVQQRDGQKLALGSARLDLAEVSKRGSSDSRRLAQLDLENAKAKLTDIRRQLDGAVIKAPAAGIVLRPPAQGLASGSTAGLATAGTRIQRGQAAMVVADMTNPIVFGKVDEVDLNKIRIGQAVSVTSDAFAGVLLGRVTGVSAEADPDSVTRVPTFSVRAAVLGNNDNGLEGIKIGMSARMSVELGPSAATIVIPINAVSQHADGATVTIVDAGTGTMQERPVKVGATTPTGIEVMAGLKDGDVLAIR
jgi:HlyD family secretion protein